MTIPRQNPFPVTSGDTVLGWQWYDETGAVSKLYKSQYDALHALVRYMKWLECGTTPWQRVWWPLRFWLWPKVKEFWNDTGRPS